MVVLWVAESGVSVSSGVGCPFRLGSELRFVIWRLALESPCSPGCPGGGISGVESRGHLWGYRGSNIIRALQGEPESS